MVSVVVSERSATHQPRQPPAPRGAVVHPLCAPVSLNVSERLQPAVKSQACGAKGVSEGGWSPGVTVHVGGAAGLQRVFGAAWPRRREGAAAIVKLDRRRSCRPQPQQRHPHRRSTGPQLPANTERTDGRHEREGPAKYTFKTVHLKRDEFRRPLASTVRFLHLQHRRRIVSRILRPIRGRLFKRTGTSANRN